MTDTSPTLDWATAPDQFRGAFENTKTQLEQAQQDAARADQLARENAMLKAGVDMSHPAAATFVAGYSGPLEVDDVKAAWEPIGGTPPPTPPPTTTAPPTNDDGSDPIVVAQLNDLQAQRNQLSNGGTAPGEEPTVDPQTGMIQRFHHGLSKGHTRERATNDGLAVLFEAAANGDPRVTSDSPEGSVRNWRQKNEF